MIEKRIAVLGGGSWATAIVKILLNNASVLHWWVRESEIIEGVSQFGHNPLFLSSVDLPSSRLVLSNTMKEVVLTSDILILAIPSAFLNDAFHSLSPEDFEGKVICSAVKGIVPQTHQVVAQYLEEVWKVPKQNIAVISGPSHAEEIALEKLTYLTSASLNQELASLVAELFKCRYIRTHTSVDLYGIEYAAVLKNIYAISVGISKGLGYGDNFRAVLVANALREMDLFLAEIQDTERALMSAPYLGDLLVTSYSQHGRNRAFGAYIGEGYSVESIMLEMNMVAEGYYACPSIQKIKGVLNLNMPILEAVYQILYCQSSPSVVFRSLEKVFV